MRFAIPIATLERRFVIPTGVSADSQHRQASKSMRPFAIS
jgi:hypothetical protein